MAAVSDRLSSVPGLLTRRPLSARPTATMAKGKRRKERLRALKLAARGDDVAMDGIRSVDSAPPLTGLTAFAPTFATESRATEDEATTTTTTTFSSDIVREKDADDSKGDRQAQEEALDRLSTPASRRQADRKKLRKCARSAAKDVY